MDFKRNEQAPQQPAAQAGPAGQYAPHGHGMVMKVVVVILVLAVFLALAVGLLMATKTKGQKDYTGIKSGQYQAVFLTNGQVYFGKLSDINDAQAKISNIYYLQVQQKVQPAEKNQNQVSLAKLGQELHGPEDTMFLSKDQILFWENMKNDSKVVQAIKSAQ